MKSDRLVILAVLFLAGGLVLLFGFTNGATSLSVGYPFANTRFHADVTTTGLPALFGVPLVAAGALLLLFALIAAIVSQFRHEEPRTVFLEEPGRRRGPFAESNEYPDA